MKEKRKIICLFMSFLCILMITFSFAFVRTKAEGNNEELVVGVPVDRCPVFYLEKGTGKVTGIGVDLMTIAAENAGYKVKFTQIKEPWIVEENGYRATILDLGYEWLEIYPDGEKYVGDYKQEINTSSKKIIIKSAPQSYGIALGLDAIVEHLRSNEYSR